MAKKLKEVDAVVIGVGWAGAILARELTLAGLTVVGLERGPDRRPAEDFALPGIRDELKYQQRLELIGDNSIDTITFRNQSDQRALPIRRWGAFLPGEGVGGTGNHWGALHWRFAPEDFRLRTALRERYGAKSIPAAMTVQDWPVNYGELEPYYDRFDKLCGVSGKAGNLRGRKIDGGNPFEGPRSDEYPNRPVAPSEGGLMFAAAAKGLGYHPFPVPFSAASAPYKNIYGVTMGACQQCGFCDRTACEANAKASSVTTIMPALRQEPKFELRTRAFASRLLYDKAAKRVTGVLYTDLKTGAEYEQPANIVILSAFVFSNTHMLLHSGIGQPYDHRTGSGLVGKNYCYQFEAGAAALFPGKELNPYMGAPGGAHVIDDFNGANFDHTGLGFFGGGYFLGSSGGSPPIGGHFVPPGTPAWGSQWKRETVKWYDHATHFNTQGSVYAQRDNYMDMDPVYQDALGRPLLRLTYNATDNDHAMSRYLLTKLEGIIKAMGPSHYELRPRPKNFSVVPYQSTHNTGGTIMGTSPGNSVVNRYLQAWDAHNLFVMGASTFPQQHGYNPTGTLGALALWSAAKITKTYLKTPGPLVHA
jgi:gluconate 2-dehydrogenase alpha chain